MKQKIKNMKVHTLKVQAIEHFDIKGNKLHYVIIRKETPEKDGSHKEVYINVGEKNFNLVSDILKQEETA